MTVTYNMKKNYYENWFHVTNKIAYPLGRKPLTHSPIFCQSEDSKKYIFDALLLSFGTCDSNITVHK